MREFLFMFPRTVVTCAGLLVLAKTIHYSLTIRRKNLINWFYFNFFSIVNSQTEEGEKAKRLQNKLTISIMLLIILTVSSFFITRVLERFFPAYAIVSLNWPVIKFYLKQKGHFFYGFSNRTKCTG
jgi:hypothetical protein